MTTIAFKKESDNTYTPCNKFTKLICWMDAKNSSPISEEKLNAIYSAYPPDSIKIRDGREFKKIKSEFVSIYYDKKNNLWHGDFTSLNGAGVFSYSSKRREETVLAAIRHLEKEINKCALK